MSRHRCEFVGDGKKKVAGSPWQWKPGACRLLASVAYAITYAAHIAREGGGSFSILVTFHYLIVSSDGLSMGRLLAPVCGQSSHEK